jgi:hypothetical protein
MKRPVRHRRQQADDHTVKWVSLSRWKGNAIRTAIAKAQSAG